MYHLWAGHQLVGRATEYRNLLYLCFMDLTQGIGHNDYGVEYGVAQQLVEIIEHMLTATRCQEMTTEDTSEKFGEHCHSAGLCSVPPPVPLYCGQDPEGGDQVSVMVLASCTPLREECSCHTEITPQPQLASRTHYTPMTWPW